MPFTLRGASASALGLVATQAVAFLVEASVARHLGASSLGVLAIGTGLTALGATIVTGCATAASAQVARSHELGASAAAAGQLRLAVRIATLAAVAVTLLLLLSADELAFALTHSSNAAPVIRLFALALPFQSAGGIGVAVAMALGRPGAEVAYRWTDSLVRALSIPALFLLQADVTAIAALHLVASVVSVPVGLLPARWAAGPFTGPFRGDVTEFVSLAGWQTVATGAWLAARRADVLIVSAFLGPSAAGAYRLAALLASLAGTVMLALQPVFFPVAARRLASAGVAGLSDHYRRVTRFATLASAPAAAALIAGHDRIMLLFGEPFAIAGAALVIQAIAQEINAAGGHATTVVQVAGARARAAANIVVGAAAQLAALLLLTPTLGVTGAALATLIGITSTQVLQLRAMHVAGVGFADATWLRALMLVASLFVVSLVAAGVADRALLPAIGLFGIGVALFALLALRSVLPVGDRELLAGMLRLPHRRDEH